MKLDGEYVFDAGVQEVWDALFDPAVLAAVMPGCEKLELVGQSYIGQIKVKVGPIQGSFSGKVDLSDQIPPKSYKMVVDGRGAQGFVKATATIQLEPDGAKTKVKYDSDAQVGGKIASVGQRLVETSARAIVKQSLEGLAENIKIRAAAYRAAAAEQAAVATPAPSPAPLPAPPSAEPPSAEPAPAPEAAPKEEPAPTVAAAEPVAPTSAPVQIKYKQADAAKLAGAVAKEVGLVMAPILIAVVAAIAVVIYLIVR